VIYMVIDLDKYTFFVHLFAFFDKKKVSLLKQKE